MTTQAMNERLDWLLTELNENTEASESDRALWHEEADELEITLGIDDHKDDGAVRELTNEEITRKWRTK